MIGLNIFCDNGDLIYLSLSDFLQLIQDVLMDLFQMHPTIAWLCTGAFAFLVITGIVALILEKRKKRKANYSKGTEDASEGNILPLTRL